MVNYGPATHLHARAAACRASGGAAGDGAARSGGSDHASTIVQRAEREAVDAREPVLYALEPARAETVSRTRFGMREFRFDTATKRAYLNGKLLFPARFQYHAAPVLRGSGVRSSAVGRAWVRKLLVEIPKQMHWNSFRFCIGPVPDKWLDIADEAGLLIQNEFFVWTGASQWDTGRDELIATVQGLDARQLEPSRVWRSGTRRTKRARPCSSSIIPAVRGLDLSNRPWENGYNLPAGPDDPVEDHPYLFSRSGNGFPDERP